MQKTAFWKRTAFGAVTLLAAATLAACGSKSNSGSSASEEKTFVSEVTNEGTAIKGGQLNYAIVAASSSTGILMDELYQQNIDSNFVAMVDASIFGFDGDRKLDDSGLATPEFDVDGKKVTVTINSKDYKWSDGTPFTIDDYIFAIEAIAHPDYTGVRYDGGFLRLNGVDEYHSGAASSISGVEKIDDYTAVLNFKEMTPDLMYAGGDLPQYIVPKHIFKDIPVKDWESSEYARTAKFVGMGPFVIKEIVSGESMTFEPNKHYYKGAPKVSVKMDIVSPDTIASEMKAGKYDIAEMPNDQYDSFKDLSNVTLLGKIENSYEYISFNFGKWDAAAGKNVMDPNAKMADPNLRKAIAYALNTKEAGESLYNGLYHPAKSLIISFYEDLHDDSLGYEYNPEKAKELLDKAGYKDVDGDGIREDKNGKPFKISFAARTRTNTNETLIQQYLTWWKEIGLNVELYTGRTMELNSFYEVIQANDPAIDMFAAGWGTAYAPSPSGVWGEKAEFNMSRFASEKNTELLKEIDSLESFDEKKNLENYKAWQEYAHEEAFAIPTFESTVVTVVNKRVKYYDLYYGSDSKSQWETLELVADKGIVAE